MDGGNRLLLMWDQPRSLRSDDGFFLLSCERAYQQQQLACGPSDVGHVTRHAVSSRWDRNPGPDRIVMWVETSSAAARVER